MHPSPRNTGWIEVMCGPMFSGKTEELISRLRRAMIASRRVEVFKPRHRQPLFQQRDRLATRCQLHSRVVESPWEILRPSRLAREVVGIDEAHFMGPALVDVAQQLADGGKHVIIAGLDTDYLGRPFARSRAAGTAESDRPRPSPSACAAAIPPSTRSASLIPTNACSWANTIPTNRAAANASSRPQPLPTATNKLRADDPQAMTNRAHNQPRLFEHR